MPLTRRCSALLALLATVTAARAHGQVSAEAPATTASAACAPAYEQGQEQRQAGRLLEARATLRACARDECPEFIRDDCSAWYDEIEQEIPTLVLSAGSRGRDLTDVRVSIGSRVLASRVAGQAIELDPGEYDLQFSAPGMLPLTERLVIARGQRNRLLRVELAPVAAAPSRALPDPPRQERSLTAPAILAGVGAVGLIGFGALAAWGRSDESKLADSCAPRCNKNDIAEVRTKYVLSDVSLGVGVASLVAAAYVFLRAPAGAPPSPPARVALNVDGSTLSASYGGAF